MQLAIYDALELMNWRIIEHVLLLLLFFELMRKLNLLCGIYLYIIMKIMPRNNNFDMSPVDGPPIHMLIISSPAATATRPSIGIFTFGDLSVRVMYRGTYSEKTVCR